MEYKIKNCHNCPFCNNDNEYGKDACNIKEIKLGAYEELPENKVHDECPLKNESVIVKAE